MSAFETPVTSSGDLAISFTRCIFDGQTYTTYLMGAADAPLGIAFTNCVSSGYSAIYINVATPTAEVNLNVNIVDSLFIGCGGFKDYDGFLVSIGRRPPDIGSPRIRLDGTRKDIHVSF